MKWLLQLGTLLFLLVTVFAPVLEWFDRWDSAGLGSDSEFAVFVVCLALCLVLVLMKLLSAVALHVGVAWQQLPAAAAVHELRDAAAGSVLRPPLLASPLRI